MDTPEAVLAMVEAASNDVLCDSTTCDSLTSYGHMTTGVGVPTHTTPSAHIQKGDVLVAMKENKETEQTIGIVII